jgi:repressor of nif and glnA expression
MSFETQNVERKVLLILRILSESKSPMGARVIARKLLDYGVELSERAVRYHLKITDEKGLTDGLGRDGRTITQAGIEELKSALVSDKVGFVISKIELLAYRTTFDWKKRSGNVPVNTTFFPKAEFRQALKLMKEAFSAGLCVSELVAVAEEGESLGEVVVPEGKTGFATVCSIIVNGVLLKAGVPMDSRFGGILQIRQKRPLRFVELIEYSGSSLDPSEIFITSRMTNVTEVMKNGDGKILANFREIPALCRPLVEEVIDGLAKCGLYGLIQMGNTSESICEMPVGLNKVGIVLQGGLNPVAAAVEAGIDGINKAMSNIIDYRQLRSINDL